MPAVGQQSVQRLPVDNQHPSKGVALGSAQTVAIPVAPTDRPDPDKTWAQVPGEIPASSSCGLFFCSPRPFEADFLPRICVFVEFCVSLSANPLVPALPESQAPWPQLSVASETFGVLAALHSLQEDTPAPWALSCGAGAAGLNSRRAPPPDTPTSARRQTPRHRQGCDAICCRQVPPFSSK